MNPNILAKVADTEITRQQMLQIMRNLPRQQAMEVQSEAGRKRLLDEMVAGELLYLEAIEKNFDQDEAFLKSLEEAKKGLLQRHAIQRLLSNITATDEEMKAFYEEHKDLYTTEAQVAARHILVEDEEAALNIKKEIEAGLDFSEAAKKYSTCPSKEEGGNLGTFGKGSMVPEFEEAAFTLNVGTVSEPVKTQFGYHLVLVDEKIESGSQAFEEVAQKVWESVVQRKQGEVYDAKIAELTEKYPVEINAEALK